jgi:hypothetical protein
MSYVVRTKITRQQYVLNCLDNPRYQQKLLLVLFSPILFLSANARYRLHDIVQPFTNKHFNSFTHRLASVTGFREHQDLIVTSFDWSKLE